MLLKPWNNYGWSKLGAESAVQMYKNSLIVRACMTEKPFIHKKMLLEMLKLILFFMINLPKFFIKILKKEGYIIWVVNLKQF